MADNTVNDGDKTENKPTPPADREAKPAARASAKTVDKSSDSRDAVKPRPAAEAALRRNAKPAARADRNDAAGRAEQNEKPRRQRRDRSERENGNVLSSGAFWGAAAAGVGVGVALMIGRKVAVQAPTVLAGDWDKALAAEHRAVEKLFDLMGTTTNKNTTKRSVLLMQMKHALAKHALQEENAVYPALRDAGMVEGADALNHEHGYVKQYLYELDNCAKDSDEFLQIVQRFRADIDHHVREEEEVLYPQMKAQLSEAANDKLTMAMNKEGFKLA